MNIVKQSDMITLMSRGKIKKYMRVFNDFYRNNVPLGDRDKVCDSLNTEFSHFFMRDEEPSNKISYVLVKEGLAFQILCLGQRIMVHLIETDENGYIEFHKDGARQGKNIALSNFIYEYCNPEGLVILEKALLGYI